MGFVVMWTLHACAIYMGASMAGLETVDFWRAATAAIVSYILMVLVGLLLIPLALVPIINQFVGAAVLLIGTACAAKIVFSCDWKPAWTIGGVAAGLNFLAAFVLRGCS